MWGDSWPFLRPQSAISTSLLMHTELAPRFLKILFCAALLLLRSLSLADAQALEDRVIFVPPVTGQGEEGDAQFVADLLRMDIPARGFGLGTDVSTSQYSISGTLDVWDNEWAEPGDPVMYVLHLTLSNVIEERIMVEEELYYASKSDLSDWLRVILFTMLSNIPLPVFTPPTETVIECSDDWSFKWLYLGATIDWDNRRYINGDYTSVRDGVGGRVFAELHFLNFASLELGMGLAREQPVYNGQVLTTLVMEGYGLLKGAIKPSRFLMLEPYAGFIFNLPLGDAIMIPPFAWTAGFQAGMRMGPGLFVVDTRFAMDVGTASIGTAVEFSRQLVRVGIGYKIGFFDRKKKEDKGAEAEAGADAAGTDAGAAGGAAGTGTGAAGTGT